MTWLIMAMGVLLILVGAVSVISGAPIIQIERGWAEVISGSVAVSGGVITFAIGVLLFRLQAWRDAMAARPVAAAPAAPVPAESMLRPTRAPDEPIAIASAPPPEPASDADEAETEHPNLWKTVPPAAPASIQPTAAVVAASGLAAAADESAEPAVRERAAAAALPSPEPGRREEAEALQRRLAFPPAGRPDLADQARRPPVNRDWMTRPLLRPRPPQPPPAQEPPPLFAGPPADPDEDRAPAIQSPMRGEDDTLQADPAPRLDAEPAERREPAVPEISIVGRYQAGSSTYTMFSNGSIDVETESGDTHHFTSMDELKAFIARQENTVS